MNSSNNNPHKEMLIKRYFEAGLQYHEIILILAFRHKVHVSLRTMNRILRKLHLKRKNCPIDTREIISNFQYEIQESGGCLGYRSMHHRLILSGYQCNRETVRLALKSLDPEGVDMHKTHRLTRRRYTNPGPNYLWHLDGNDKLKPFGLGIHGCIDGYSRRILWLEVSRSNKDPTIVGKYFLDCIHQFNGAPRAIRADRGVENTIIAGIQRYFHNFENSSFLFGKSTSNQRIEAGWSFFRRRFLQIWMNLFKDMRDEGLYDDSNVFHVECLVFRMCYQGDNTFSVSFFFKIVGRFCLAHISHRSLVCFI